MKTEDIKRGIEIVESCLDNCVRLHLEVNVFQPNQTIMDILLEKDYLSLRFNSEDPDNDILIFHDSEDKYAHNGDIRFTCFLHKVPEVLKYVRKHKKVTALIKEMKQK